MGTFPEEGKRRAGGEEIFMQQLLATDQPEVQKDQPETQKIKEAGSSMLIYQIFDEGARRPRAIIGLISNDKGDVERSRLIYQSLDERTIAIIGLVAANRSEP